jgi:hypothetical protein
MLELAAVVVEVDVVVVVVGSGTGGVGVSWEVAAPAEAAIKSSVVRVSRTTAERVESMSGWTL